MDVVEYRRITEKVVMPHTDPYVVVVAPVLWCWHHPFLRRWAICLRRLGYTGWLPSWAVGTCHTFYPKRTCPCGAYHPVWRDWPHVPGG
jgi:hypothetical protein